MNTFGMNVVASDKTFCQGRGVSITLPAKDGGITILAHHADMMVAIVPGEIFIETDKGEKLVGVCGGGFAQVINNRVTVLVDTMERPEDIDVKRAQEAMERAQEQLRQKQSQQEYYISKQVLSRAMARMKATRDRGI